jgi:hypothetical protein
LEDGVKDSSIQLFFLSCVHIVPYGSIMFYLQSRALSSS